MHLISGISAVCTCVRAPDSAKRTLFFLPLYFLMVYFSRLLLVYLLFDGIQNLNALPAQTGLAFDDADKPKITLKPDGSFKIVVMSDVHFGEDAWTEWGPAQDRHTLNLFNKVLREENMDYVVLLGDQITGENTFKHNSTLYIDKIVGPLNEIGVPFSSIHGNHDNQANITHLAEIKRERQISPNSYTRSSPTGIGGEGGEGNYWVPIYQRADDLAPSLILWFFDSRGGYSPGPDSHPIEDWVHPSVAGWIQTETQRMNDAWGPASNRGALAFVHIPPYLARELQANLNSTVSPGLNDDQIGEGSSQPEGKDTIFWNALITHVPNLHAVISGHDHGNEWCARERKDRVVFCFAKHSGYGGYNGSGWGWGVRDLVFEQFDTITSMKTWIRMENGDVKGFLNISDTFDP